MKTESPTPQSTRTTCPYCGVGCGIAIAQTPDGAVQVEGDRDHPANYGRLCVKGSALAETLGMEDRLTHPQINGLRATWSQAIQRIAEAFGETIKQHGPDSVALYVSGQILTEDYYVANKLMKGFIGSANIDTNSRLCMSSSVAGHKRAFGADIVPAVYADLETADLVVLVGSNLAWCHPVLHQRIMAAREKRGGKPFIVNIDPRRNATSESADLQLSLAPGADVALFSGLLHFLAENGQTNQAYVAAHTQGAEAALEKARAWTIERVADETGLALADLAAFYALFAQTDKVVTLYSQGVNQSSAGTDKVNAILNCHLLTGRIGRPGCGPLSATGQPNAMGGREVGGLANQLACHMDIENSEHRARVQKFWRAPRMAQKAGLKAVDLFRAVAEGKVKAIWIMGTNPIDSTPEADFVRAALKACPFVAVSDVVKANDTLDCAQVVLPALAWGEKDGTVTNSERRISRQRAFRASPGDARPDWRAICDVAKELGFAEGFDFAGPAAIFREHAALSGYENDGARDFDISAFADISDKAYDGLTPFQWPAPKDCPPKNHDRRFFAEGGFYTPDRRARLIAIDYRPPREKPDTRHPFVLNTGRIRDQWHTMTRTGVAPRLAQHIAEPFVEIHPDDAARLGVAAADLVRLSNDGGAVILRALVTERQRPGSLFAPIHWTDKFASQARISALIAAHVDPLSGQPESKAAVVAAKRVPTQWFGFAMTRQKPAFLRGDYWALAKIAGGWRIELAGFETPRDWELFAREFFIDAQTPDFALMSVGDPAQKNWRCIARAADAILGALYIARTPVEAARAWLVEEFSKPTPDALALLAGRPAMDRPDPGRKICVCFDVGANDIARAIAKDGLTNLDAIGRATNAGAGCGSCRPEITALLAARAAQQQQARHEKLQA